MQPQYNFDIADAFQLGKYVLVGIVALIIVIFVVRGIYLASPADYTVAGQQVSLARGTTYQGLLDSGELDAAPGNLVAVDDEVLQEGGGKQPTVYLNGEPVDLNSRISDQGDITAENGEDEIEPYSATQEITPITTQLDQANNFNFYNGVLHVVTDPGQEGITETRTGETTGRTATVKVQDMKPRHIENLEASIPSGKKLVALTFDDGPNPAEGGTQEILDVLAKYNVKATFFMLGSQAEEFPDMARKVANAGHQVATHSYSHDEKHYLNQTTEEDVIYQIGTARKVVGEATGTDPAYIRPPGGNIDAKAIMAADTLADGYIGWSIDTLDYTLPGSDSIARTVLSEVEPGSVVLMHDGGGDRSQTAAALDEAIPKLQEEGYTLVTIDELVQAILAERTGSQQGQEGQASQATQGSEQTSDGNADEDSGNEGEGSEQDA
ncbi:MAG: polysaccharide deacetylase family protein [Coriobacteriia bacterium]|nr:polysaccharide deacetylase family protein [Coriobacteriia bacterium]